MVCFFVNNAKLNNSANDSSFKVVIWPPAVVGRVLQNRVCPSFRPSFCWSGSFLEIASLVFSKFWHGARNLYEVVPDKAGFSGEKKFCHQNWENRLKMGQKQGFLYLLKSLVINFYWICSKMKIYIICCVPSEIPYLGNFFFLKYGPKCSQPFILQDFLTNHISRTDQWKSLIFCMLI